MNILWRGSLLPLGCVAVPLFGPLRAPAGASSLATLLDMARIGDAVLQATGALRMNYEILGNSEPELHCHIFPRYAWEPDDKRKMPAWFYDWKTAMPYAEEQYGDLREKIAQLLNAQ